VVDQDIENGAQGMRTATDFLTMGRVHKINEVLVGAEARIDIQVVIDVVPGIFAGVEDSR